MNFGHRELTLAKSVSDIPRLKLKVGNRVNQYKKKFKEWGIEKNVKEDDTRAIVRKDLKRKAEDPFRATIFRLRKRLIPTEKTERYRREHGLVEGTIISDGGTRTSIVRGVVALANFLNVATPSDLSCETPVPITVDDHERPSQVEYQPSELQDAHMQSASLPHAPDPAFEALTGVDVNLHEQLISRSSTPREPPILTLDSDAKALGLDEARGSLSPEIDAQFPLDQKHYSSCVEFLKPLMAQLRKLGLLALLLGPNGSPAEFYRRGFRDYIQEFRYHVDKPQTLNQSSISTEVRIYASSSSESCLNGLFSRLEMVYTDTSIGGDGFRPYDGRDGLVTLFAKLDSFMSGFDTEYPKVRSCIGRNGFWQFFSQAHVAFTCENYRAALGRRACSCFMCLKLSTLLNFYHTIEAFQLYAVAEALGYTVDHFCLKVFVGRTKISSKSYSAVAKLHQRLTTSWGLHWVYEPVSTDSDDP